MILKEKKKDDLDDFTDAGWYNMSTISTEQKFDASVARATSRKLINNAREIQRIHARLRSAMNSVSWWTGDSKKGFITRGNTMLEHINAMASNALELGNNLTEITKSKEAEERELRSSLKDVVADIGADNAVNG